MSFLVGFQVRFMKLQRGAVHCACLPYCLTSYLGRSLRAPPRRGTCRAGEEAELVKFVTEFLQEVLPRPCQPSTQADPHAADSALSCQAPDRAIASSPAGRTPKRFKAAGF